MLKIGAWKEKIRSKRWKINYNYRRYDGQGTAQQAPGKNFQGP